MKGNYWELSDGIFDRINDENRQSYVDFMIKNPFLAKRKFVNVNAYKQLQGIIIIHCMHFKISILSVKKSSFYLLAVTNDSVFKSAPLFLGHPVF